jgi:serine/threonine-protein kinase HipA
LLTQQPRPYLRLYGKKPVAFGSDYANSAKAESLMQTISKPLFIYLQRPDTAEWVTVGRYLSVSPGHATFKYAPSYVGAGLHWSIDPVNLPFLPDVDVPAQRYRGLHDVLRDACPDAWGQALLRREHNLLQNAAPFDYLRKASNLDRWGALAVGSAPKPPIATFDSPSVPQLSQVIEELAAIAELRPSVRANVRRRLVQTASLGGARPKATVRDENGQFWLVKPRIASDIADIPRLEHACQQWGAGSGLHFARTELHLEKDGRSAVRVLRFDRNGQHRHMCLSAASMLQAEYPDNLTQTDRWSYSRLADELRRVGAPADDRKELFGRMVFNAVCGNDDDHVRNHAIVYQARERMWRLAPAFDVVANPSETPRRLSMQLALGRFDISREAVLADALRFGFDNRDACSAYLDELLGRMRASFDASVACLDEAWRQTLHERLQHNATMLGSEAAWQ